MRRHNQRPEVLINTQRGRSRDGFFRGAGQHRNEKCDKMLSSQGALVLAKSGRLEQGDNTLGTL